MFTQVGSGQIWLVPVGSLFASLCAPVSVPVPVSVSLNIWRKGKEEEDETDSTRLEERTWGGVQLVHIDRTYVKFFTSNSFLGLERVVCFACIVTIDFDFIPFSL